MKTKQLFCLAFSLCSLLISPSGEAAKLISPPPVELTESLEAAPLSLSPLLYWSKDINAVSYEVEISTEIPKKLSPKRIYRKAVFRDKYVYQNYYNPPIADYIKLAPGEVKQLFWRVRSLDVNKKPISPFSKTAVIFVSSAVPPMNAPVPLHPTDDDKNEVQLLYPVYCWTKEHDSNTFEVELYDSLPNEKSEPIWRGTSTYQERYDDYPRTKDTPFYWRVRAFDKNGKQLGNWSKFTAFSFQVKQVETAVFGDSVSHGGGHLSFGPNHAELSWLSYLNFPATNLSQSGNLTRDMVERFEKDVLPFAPKFLLIMGGTNDIRNNEVPVEETIKNLSILKEKCLKNNIRPIFLSLPPINPQNTKKVFNEVPVKNWQEKLQKCNAFIRTMPYYIDTATYFAPICKKGLLPTKYALDGLHPDANGKALIAKSVNDNWLRVTK